jgi:hypothetical protein
MKNGIIDIEWKFNDVYYISQNSSNLGKNYCYRNEKA